MLTVPLIFLIAMIACLGILFGIISIILIFDPTASSRTMGATSIACVVIATGLLWNIAGSVVSDGILPLMCLMPGVIDVIANRKPPRVLTGHCLKCGYNLTGNISGKCSECGALVPAP